MRTEIPEGPQNKALKLTKGAEVRAPRHSASLRRCSVPRSTFFTNVPSQLNAVLGGRGCCVAIPRGDGMRFTLLVVTISSVAAGCGFPERPLAGVRPPPPHCSGETVAGALGAVRLGVSQRVTGETTASEAFELIDSLARHQWSCGNPIDWGIIVLPLPPDG